MEANLEIALHIQMLSILILLTLLSCSVYTGRSGIGGKSLQ